VEAAVRAAGGRACGMQGGYEETSFRFITEFVFLGLFIGYFWSWAECFWSWAEGVGPQLAAQQLWGVVLGLAGEARPLDTWWTHSCGLSVQGATCQCASVCDVSAEAACCHLLATFSNGLLACVSPWYGRQCTGAGSCVWVLW
jgi:hypothetical protein